MQIFVIITSYKEEKTVGKAIEQIIGPNRDLWADLKLLITSPDDPTLKEAEEVCHKYNFDSFRIIKDSGVGKSEALNKAVETIRNNYAINHTEDVLIMTDGDMYVSDGAVKSLLKGFSNEKVGGVGGHPVSLDGRDSLFGYFSHMFCAAAHERRLKDSAVPMSGYVYAVRYWDRIFPLPFGLRAEDAYISHRLRELGYACAYAQEAMAYVKFPKNMNDWFKQKTRSLGGNVQVSRSTRSVTQDLGMALFPLTYATNLRELTWSLLLYPMRAVLWAKIYVNHLFNRYSTGMWDRVESTK